MSPPGPVNRRSSRRLQRGGGKPASLFYCVRSAKVAFCCRIQEPDMLQDIPSPSLRGASPSVLETERLTLRRPTLADVKAIARLANDRRIAENTRRLPHPYCEEHAIEFVRHVADTRDEVAFLIEHNFTPVGVAGILFREGDFAEIGYWLGVEHWGQGFGTEATRAVIDYFF